MQEFTDSDSIAALSGQLSQVQKDLSVFKKEMQWLAEVGKRQNQMLDIALKTLEQISDPITGCGWVAHKTALMALMKISEIKIPSPELFEVAVKS